MTREEERRAELDREPERWEGLARMATARAAAGVELDQLDREALRRAS